MKSFVLILLIGFMSASPLDAQCNYFGSKTRQCSNGKDFAETVTSSTTVVCNLQDKYNPAYFTPASYQQPQCKGTSANVDSNYLKLLEAAYDLAPPSIQSKLCNLTHVFVITATSYPANTALESLGVWAASDQTMYIAVPYNVLQSAQTLPDEENGNYGKLLSVTPYPGARQLPSFQNPPTSPGAPNPRPAPGTPGFPNRTQVAAVLAVLLHELGHIMLADTNADGAGFAGKPGHRPCPAPAANSCFETEFLAGWDANTFHNNGQRRWIAFGDEHSNQYQRASGFHEINADVKKNTSSDDAKTTASMQSGIYGGQFVSLFAAVSPEEDFVETYKYKALANVSPPLSLNISFPGGSSPDVLDYVRGNLTNKKMCVP